MQERTGTVIIYDEKPVVKAASRFVKSTIVLMSEPAKMLSAIASLLKSNDLKFTYNNSMFDYNEYCFDYDTVCSMTTLPCLLAMCIDLITIKFVLKTMDAVCKASYVY